MAASILTGSTIFIGSFEVTDSDPLRVTATAGSRPADLPRNMVTVFVTGPFNKLINLVVHDLGDGLFSGSTAEGLEIYGSVFYNNGWIGPDRGHGHNLYLQNQNATKNVIDNVLFNSFDAGLHIYGSDVAYLWNFNIEGNTIFDSGDPAVGTFSTSLNILQHGGNGNYGRSVYRDNSIYQRDGRDFALAFNTAGGIPGQDIKFLKNIVHGQALFYEMNGYTITDNKFTSGTNPLSGSSVLVGLRMIVGQPYTSNTWNGNRYATPAGGTQDPFYLVGMSSAVYKFPLWQSTTGYDAGGSSTYGEFPGADVIVRPNRYESGRAFITCWNWNGASTVNVDLSSVLKPGDQFEIHHVFDLVGAPILTGTYDGGPVSIPQSTLTPPPPLGYKASPTMPDNRFNVFLVQKR